MPRRNVSRRNVMVTTVTFSVGALAGCSGTDGSGDDGSGNGDDEVEEKDIGGGDASVSLGFASWGEGAEREALEQGLTGFTEENPDVSVNYQTIPYGNYHDRLQTQFGANEEPDIFYVDLSYMGTFAASDVLLNLSEEFTDDYMDQFVTEVVDRYRTTDGDLFMFPFASSPIAISYNSEVLDEAGIEEFPETWDDFKPALEAIRDETDVYYPFIDSDNVPAWIWRAWVYANGGEFMNDDNTECIIANDESVEALEFFEELRQEELIGTLDEIQADSAEAGINGGEVAMTAGGSSVLSLISADYPDLFEKMDVARPPRPTDGEFGNEVAGAGLSISANSDETDVSLDLVRHMLDEGVVPYLESGVSVPTKESQLEEISLYAEDERYQRIADMREDPRLGSPSWGPHTVEIMNELNPQLEGVIQGQVSARDALTEVERRVNEEILE